MVSSKKSGSTKKSAKKSARKIAASKAPSAAQLKALQAKLNENAELRGRFLKNPGAVLRQHGVELTRAKEAQLATFTRDVTGPRRESSGVQLQRVNVGLGIGIGVRVCVGVSVGIFV